jgi:Protein of unknown function (DUF3501)
MTRIERSEVKDLVAYEKVREETRARVIEVKKARRIALGDTLTLLFENRETVLFQIQEMARAERIVDAGRIQDEIEAYQVLLPGPGELSATLFIEIMEIARMTTAQIREAVNRFQGLDQGTVFLELGGHRVPARFESGDTKEEKMAAVHYVRFAVPAEGRAALADPAQPVRLIVAHPRYRAEAAVPPELRAQMAADLAG